MTSEIRLNEARQAFKEYPDKIEPAIQARILAQQVVLGMKPYECYLAAGVFQYGVQADPSKWKNNADPMKVMWAQSITPDNSKIHMTFQTDTQYPGEGLTIFRVDFEHGQAVKITKHK